MRVSDTERQRAIDELRRHCAAGRIDVEEYARRVERALSATTLEELDGLRDDLPMLRIPEPAGHGGIWARSGPPAVIADEPATGGKLTATMVAVLAVALVLAAVILAVVASWTWALLLVIGWAAGEIHARLRTAKR
jgi:hypothetical protein